MRLSPRKLSVAAAFFSWVAVVFAFLWAIGLLPASGAAVGVAVSWALAFSAVIFGKPDDKATDLMELTTSNFDRIGKSERLARKRHLRVEQLIKEYASRNTHGAKEYRKVADDRLRAVAKIAKRSHEERREGRGKLLRQAQQASARLRDLVDMMVVAYGVPGSIDAEESGSLAAHASKRRLTAMQNISFRLGQEESQIRELYLAEIFEGIEEHQVPVGAAQEDTGHPNKIDMLYVVAIAQHMGCKRIFEIGTNLGRTAYYLAAISGNVRVFTLDLPVSDGGVAPHIGSYFRDSDLADQITQLVCDSRDLDTTPYSHSMDLVFVDGDHSYDLVKNDTVKALELLAPAGIILWHDYAPKAPGIVQFVKEFTGDRPVFRITNTSLLVYIDGVDPMSFDPKKPTVELKRRHQRDVLLLP